jgi:hypothetical protein
VVTAAHTSAIAAGWWDMKGVVEESTDSIDESKHDEPVVMGLKMVNRHAVS